MLKRNLKHRNTKSQERNKEISTKKWKIKETLMEILELENTITKIKNRHTHIPTQVTEETQPQNRKEKRISELEDRKTETMQSEQLR